MLHLTAAGRQEARWGQRLCVGSSWSLTLAAVTHHHHHQDDHHYYHVMLLMSSQAGRQAAVIWFAYSAQPHVAEATFICNMRPANVCFAAADECQCNACSLRLVAVVLVVVGVSQVPNVSSFLTASLPQCASCLLVGVASTQQRDLTPTWICITKATQIARCSLCCSACRRQLQLLKNFQANS